MLQFILLLTLHVLTWPAVSRPGSPEPTTQQAIRIKGFFLASQIRSGLSERQVEALLGSQPFCASGGTGFEWYYDNLGIAVWWYRPKTYFSPSDNIGTPGMILISSLPTWWVRLFVVPALSGIYTDQPELAGVRWCGVPLYRKQR